MGRTITVNGIERMASEANKRFFEGKLDLSKITFKINSRLTTTLGRCRFFKDKTSVIEISKILTVSKDELYHTLVHELIHYWQGQNNYSLDHGNRFYRMASIIWSIEKSININRTRVTTGLVAEKIAEKRTNRIKNQYTIVAEAKNGSFQYNVTKFIPSKADITNVMERYNGLSKKYRAIRVYENKNTLSNYSHSRDFCSCIKSFYTTNLLEMGKGELAQEYIL